MGSPRIVLTPTSPLRLHILCTAGIEPPTVAPDVNEDFLIAVLPDAMSIRIVEQLAQAKAYAVTPEYPNDIAIGGGSVLLLDGHLQREPHTKGKTIKRQHQQDDRIAELVTGHCVATPKSEHIEVAITSLDFVRILEEDVHAYIVTGKSLECTGAFTLEALGGWLVNGINGDSSSVVGLSLPVVHRALYRYDYSVSQS